MGSPPAFGAAGNGGRLFAKSARCPAFLRGNIGRKARKETAIFYCAVLRLQWALNSKKILSI